MVPGDNLERGCFRCLDNNSVSSISYFMSKKILMRMSSFVRHPSHLLLPHLSLCLRLFLDFSLISFIKVSLFSFSSYLDKISSMLIITDKLTRIIIFLPLHLHPFSSIFFQILILIKKYFGSL